MTELPFPLPRMDETVARLAVRTFTAGELIAAAEVTPDNLDIWQRKAGLQLATEPPGRGRARRFCLLDVYLVALMSRLTRLTGSQVWSARSLDYLVYAPFPATMQGQPMHRGPGLDTRRTDLVMDIGQAHELFWTRSWHSRPWVLFVEDSHVDTGIYGMEVANVADLDALIHRREGYFLNATRRLHEVDQHLVAMLGEA